MSTRAEILEAIMAVVRANFENGALEQRFKHGEATKDELRAAWQVHNFAYRRMVALLDLWPYREAEPGFMRHGSSLRGLELTDPAGRRN